VNDFAEEFSRAPDDQHGCSARKGVCELNCKEPSQSTTPTILDQISAEKTKVSERLARLDSDRATVATQLTDLETAERVLTRVSKTPPARRPTLAAAADAKAPTATRGRGRPPIRRLLP
jgi:hypothetical protein